ncbi:YhdH/YhfP family quinone oxidoreductase [Botrimarina sp.]|uniref:YhdH/YhfP family quinone oxidoreductase n=1 Tax=Botrimarina sp. TaxID=2795802 RepID=UPI0032EED8CF
MSKSFAAWVVDKATDKSDAANGGGVRELTTDDLPPVDGPSVLIEVECSSLNYKDALACQGHPGVVNRFPHVPGIDCAGRVLESDSASFAPDDPVLVTGYDLGAARWGGYSGLVRVPADWPVSIKDRLSPAQAMAYGTAGFTAAQCVMAVQRCVEPGRGDVLVTGATGGVGVYAVAILAKLGYRVVAVTGKPAQADTLRGLGAAEVVGRDVLEGESDAPLLSERWAAAVDTVGGAPLATLVRSIRHRGVVAACGLVAGAELPLTVYPFILRGVTLAGVDSAKCPREPRLEVWRRLSGPWRVDLPQELVDTVTLDELPDAVARILSGRHVGRTLVRPTSEAALR